MKSGFLKKHVVALSVALIAPAVCLAPSLAGNVQNTLIDKEFEVALRKFVTKRFYNRIEATDEQRQKLDSLLGQTQEDTRPMREQLRHGLLDLSAMMAGDATDEQIVQKVQELRQLKQKIMDKRIDTALQVRKVLTPAQRNKIHDRVSELIQGGLKPKRLSMLIDQ